jgi:hypothetical protein
MVLHKIAVKASVRRLVAGPHGHNDNQASINAGVHHGAIRTALYEIKRVFGLNAEIERQCRAAAY